MDQELIDRILISDDSHPHSYPKLSFEYECLTLIKVFYGKYKVVREWRCLLYVNFKLAFHIIFKINSRTWRFQKTKLPTNS